MKWFLQFLSLGSVVIYTLLVIIDNRIPDGTAENPPSLAKLSPISGA